MLAALCLLGGLLWVPSARAQGGDAAIKTTLCAIKASPMEFNGKVVEVAGYASHGFEDSMFEDPGCFWNKDRPGIWMMFGGKASVETRWCCGAERDPKKVLVVQGVPTMLVHDHTFDQFEKLLKSEPGRGVTVHATVRGRVFVREVSLPLGHHYMGGYGHMGCCMLLAIEQVMTVDSTAPGASIYDLAAEKEKGPEKKAN